jgi:prepilin-type N-terminal cleavage/methylation domain-containing protein
MSMKRRRAFTIVELMFVVALVGLLMSVSIPALRKARVRSHRNQCLQQQRFLEVAKDEFAMQERKSNGYYARWSEILPYLGLDDDDPYPRCPSGRWYYLGRIGEKCYCHAHDFREADVW